MSLTLHLTKSVVEQEKVFRLACFNLFTHNRDDHAKNFSFLMDEKGLWTLSPVYDMTFSQGPGGEHSTMYLGEGKNPTVAHLLRLGEKHGLKSRERVIEEVKASVQKWKEFATVAGLSSTTMQGLGKIFFKIARQ
jgi:serine/threonine-protein kinase HipA